MNSRLGRTTTDAPIADTETLEGVLHSSPALSKVGQRLGGMRDSS